MKVRSGAEIGILALVYGALVACVAADEARVAAGIYVFARIAYVGFVARVLRDLSDRPVGVTTLASERKYRRFKWKAARLMEVDAIAFGVFAWATRGSFDLGLPRVALVSIGALLFAVGVGVKVAAARTIGAEGYYWRDFFFPPKRRNPSRTGPYRYLEDPMYTAGYLHAYGFAIALGSLEGIVAVFFAQALILAMNAMIERPHFLRLYRKRAPSVPQMRA